jgi:outer membrane protein assembly factor BamD
MTMTTQRLLPSLGLALGLVVAPGCAHNIFSDATATTVHFTDTPKSNYELGEKELADKNWLEALKYFEYVSAKFPYSIYSPMAELAIADADYDQEKYVEAIDRYQNFLKLHPTHAKVDYASYRVGLSYYEQIPSAYFFLPSPAEKDQTNERKALSALEDFVRGFPKSSYLGEAKGKITDLRTRLADHEMRIASFYSSHDRPLAAAGRYETVVRDYPDTDLEPEALIRLGRIYLHLNDKAKAKQALEKLISEHPTDGHAGEAKKLLEQTS